MNVIRTIKSRFLNTELKLSRRELLLCVLILLLVAYLFAPKGWEPGDESFKNWVSARMFRHSGIFPPLYHSPLQNIYLQLFLFFDYPLSLQLEHFFKHLFAYTALFLLLRKFLPTIPALVLLGAWIPELWTLEGGASRVAGMGCLALYLGSGKQSAWHKGYFPASLAAAALFDSAFTPFLLGHMVGTMIKRYANKEALVRVANPFKNKEILPMLAKVTMGILLILTVSFPSKRADGNPHLVNYPWAPFPQRSALTISSLQFGNWKYVMRNVAQPQWIYQDWYFTHQKAFAGAQNILQAAVRKPEVFFRNVLENVPGAASIPLNFIIGFRLPPGFFGMFLLVLSWGLLPVCLFRVFRYFRQKDMLARVYAIVFGSSALVCALLLTCFSRRFVTVLLPVGLITSAHIGTSLQSLLRFRVAPAATPLPSRSRIFPVLGFLLILSGLLLNQWSVAAFISADGILLPATKILVWSTQFLLIALGMLLIIKRDFCSALIARINDGNYSNTQSWFTSAVILVMAGCIFSSSLNAQGGATRVGNLSKNPFLLSGRMAAASGQLLASVNKQTKVLALEEPWIRAFANVDTDKVFHALYLPPFEDTSGKTEEFLESLDVIWVSEQWSTAAPSLATQTYLRYKLHVEPFLEKALKKGWTVQEVEGFGKIYRNGNRSQAHG